MTVHNTEHCPNQKTSRSQGEHDWYSKLIVFGVALIRKCRTCGAKRVF